MWVYYVFKTLQKFKNRHPIIYTLREKLSLPTLRVQHVKLLFVGLYSNLNVFPVDLRGGKGFSARAEGKEVQPHHPHTHTQADPCVWWRLV